MSTPNNTPVNKRRWLLYIFERAREPTAAAEERLQRAVRANVPDGRESRALLGNLPSPAADAEARLLARLVQIPAEEPRRASPGWLRPTLALAGAGAACLGLLLLLPAEVEEPTALATALPQHHAPVDLAPVPGVSLAYHDGYGELGGTTRAPRIHWLAGQIDVEVEPERGIDLAIETDEAMVRVVGTRFSVTRADGLTSVAVARGKVEVTCADGQVHLLTAGQAHSCEPRSPARLALRALRLAERGGDPARVLALADKGLAEAVPGGAVADQLRVIRLRALRDLARREEALAEAEDYLAAGGSRRALEVARLALALSDEPCDVALEHRALLEAGHAEAGDLVALADCLVTQDPAASEALLHRGLADPALDPLGKERIEARLERR